MLHFFLDEGLGPQLAEAVQHVTTESALNVITRKSEIAEDKDNSFPRYQDDQFKEQFRMERSSFEVNYNISSKYVICEYSISISGTSSGRWKSYSRRRTSSANCTSLAAREIIVYVNTA